MSRVKATILASVFVLAVAIVFYVVGMQSSTDPSVQRAQQPTPSGTRLSSSIVDPSATLEPGVVAVTAAPGEATPYWLFDEALAVQYVQEESGSSDWVSYVAKRTTRARAESLFSAPSDPLPPLESDLTEPVWIIAWESSTLLSVGQIDQALGFQSPAEDDLSELVGTKAYLIVNEGQDPIAAGFLNTHYADGSVIEQPPSFADIMALPDVPGSISQ